MHSSVKQPNIPQTSTSGTHTHRQHTATYQINNLTTQTSREGSNCTKHVVSQPNIPQTSTSGTHTHRQHTATYQINNLTTQTSREGSNSTKHEKRPPEDGQTIVTETCRVLIDVFYKHF